MFSERLMRARKAAGMSMNALGIAIGVSANAIKKYEHGEAMPSSGLRFYFQIFTDLTPYSTPDINIEFTHC